MDPHSALISNLESSFDAAVAREEEEAASDLAFSLSQDLELGRWLCRGGSALLRPNGGADARIVEVGTDFVCAREHDSVTLVPFAQVVAERQLRCEATHHCAGGRRGGGGD